MRLFHVLVTLILFLLCEFGPIVANPSDIIVQQSDTRMISKRCSAHCGFGMTMVGCTCTLIIPNPTCKLLCIERPEVKWRPTPPGSPEIKAHGAYICGEYSRQHFPVHATGTFTYHPDDKDKKKDWTLTSTIAQGLYFEGSITMGGHLHLKAKYTAADKHKWLVAIKADTLTYFYVLDGYSECNLDNSKEYYNLQDITVMEKTH